MTANCRRLCVFSVKARLLWDCGAEVLKIFMECMKRFLVELRSFRNDIIAINMKDKLRDVNYHMIACSLISIISELTEISEIWQKTDHPIN